MTMFNLLATLPFLPVCTVFPRYNQINMRLYEYVGSKHPVQVVAIGFQNFHDTENLIPCYINRWWYIWFCDIYWNYKKIQLLSNFPLRVVTLDDGYAAEMFRKQLNSLALHPKFHFSDVIKFWSITWKRVQKKQFFAPFQSYICSNSIHRYATSVKSNPRHDGDSHIAINFRTSDMYVTKITTTSVSVART